MALDRIQRIISLAQKDEAGFIKELNEASGKDDEKALKKAQGELTKAKGRITALDRIISKIYEDNVEGKISDERFATMLAGYETEQNDLKTKAVEYERLIAQTGEKTEGMEKFIQLVRSYKNIEALTTEIAREFIEKIIVGEPVYAPGKQEKQQTVELIYNYVGKLPVAIEQKE